MIGLIVCALYLAMSMPVQASAKQFFYDPADIASAGSPASLPSASGLRTVRYASPFPPSGHVGIHYWFEDREGARYGEGKAALQKGPLTLHVRSNVSGYLTVWSGEGAGAELTPRMDSRWAGHLLQTEEEFLVPGSWEFGIGGTVPRLIIVFARSQTEMPPTSAEAERRQQDARSRHESNPDPQILREAEEATPGELGVYVVSRVGAPVVAEIILPGRKVD